MLAERNIMTVRQFEDWKKQQEIDDSKFMDNEHNLHCPCGQNAHTTIIEACQLGWIISTRHCLITRARCPKCAGPDRRVLERDVTRHKKIN
jgi:hypothetical protein